MFYAIKNVDGLRHHFTFQGVDSWATRAELLAAVAKWRASMTPNYAARASFEIYED